MAGNILDYYGISESDGSASADGGGYSDNQPSGGNILDYYGIGDESAPAAEPVPPSAYDYMSVPDMVSNIKATNQETVDAFLMSEDPSGIADPESKIVRLGRAVYQSSSQGIADIARFIGKQDEQVNKLRSTYINADNKYGQAMLERFDRETAEAVANVEEFAASMPELTEVNIFESVPGQIFEQAVTGMARFAPTMVATAANPAIGYAVAVSQIAGARAAEFEAQGIDSDTAWNAALLDALPNAAVETIGNIVNLRALGAVAGMAAKRVGVKAGVKRFVENLAESAAAEGLEEITQEQWSVVSEEYAKDPNASAAEILERSKNVWATWEQTKKAGYAGLVGAVGGALFPIGGVMIKGGQVAADAVTGTERPPAAAEGERQVKGPIEPLPGPEGQLGFALTDKTKIVEPGETEAETKTVGEKKEAAATEMILDQMTGDLTEEEAKVVAARFPELKKDIEKRYAVKAKKAEKAAPKKAAAKQEEVKLPKGQGGEISSMSSLKRVTPAFDLQQVAESKTTKSQTYVHAIADAIDSKVTFYKAKENTPADRVNGFYNEKSGRIFINENAAEPDLFVLGHESFHELSVKHPDLWNKAMDVIMADTANYQQYVAAIQQDRKAAALPELDAEGIKKEFGSDIAGRAFTRPGFWKELNQKAPDAFAKLRKIVSALIERVKSALKVGVGSMADVKRMEKVEQAIADAYAEAKRRQGKVVTEAKVKAVEDTIYRMPRAGKVKVTAIHAESGKKVKINADPREALAELEGTIEKYYQVLECINAGA
jgi:hypothetical protein